MKKLFKFASGGLLKNKRVAGSFGKLIKRRFYFSQNSFSADFGLSRGNYADICFHYGTFYFIPYFLHRSFVYRTSAFHIFFFFFFFSFFFVLKKQVFARFHKRLVVFVKIIRRVLDLN